MFGKVGKLHPIAKKVIDIKNGVIYDSIRLAVQTFNITPSILYQYLDGTRINKTTLKRL